MMHVATRRFATLFLFSFVALAAMGCPSLNCMQPAVDQFSQERETATDIALKLEELKVDASLKNEFKEVTKIYFQKLSDRNAALFLFLTAIECYQRNGASEQTLLELAKIAREAFLAMLGAQGEVQNLSRLMDEEKAALAQSQHWGQKVMNKFRQIGITE